MEYTYHLKAPKMLDKIASITKKASESGYKVEFVAKDATRAESGFVASCAKIAVENGASEITVCDDAGIAFPSEIAALVKEVMEAVPSACVFVAPSDKISLACACAVASIESGACGIKTATVGDGMRPDKFADLIRAKGDALNIDCALDCTAIHNTVATISDTSTKTSSVKEDGENISSDATLSVII
jgi:isopropylmalate/homocitrate/citramalate synthase